MGTCERQCLLQISRQNTQREQDVMHFQEEYVT